MPIERAGPTLYRIVDRTSAQLAAALVELAELTDGRTSIVYHRAKRIVEAIEKDTNAVGHGLISSWSASEDNKLVLQYGILPDYGYLHSQPSDQEDDRLQQTAAIWDGLAGSY